MSNNTIKKSLGDSEKSPKNKKGVSSLALKICSKINGTKRSKKTAYKELEILRNHKAPIKILPIYYI